MNFTLEKNWGDNVIDSRDINDRYEELKDEFEGLESLLEDAQDELLRYKTEQDEIDDDVIKELQEAVDQAQEQLNDFNSSFEKDELDGLEEIVEQGESSPDWIHGEQLINEDYFVEYTEELVNECYEMPKEFNEGKWPWNHVDMNWEAVAEELKQDYFTIEYNGETYYIRG